MVDTVEIKEAETTSATPVEEKQSTQRVQGLREKFKSVEADENSALSPFIFSNEVNFNLHLSL